MDKNLSALIEFSADLSYRDLSVGAVDACINHILDSIGCAAGGFSAMPCRIARSIAASAHSVSGASAFGLAESTTPEYAVFANSTAVRQLDYNDTYAGKVVGGGHPSDMIPAILAGVEMAGGSGRDLILGVYIAYEIFGAIADTIPLRDLGFDQGVNVAVSAAAAVGRVTGLPEDRLANAISLALMPNLPLRVVRTGELSHWKGSAAPHAAAMAVWAVRLAGEGMTAPLDPFDGVDGLTRFTGDIDLRSVGNLIEDRSAVERCLIKFYPSELSSQVPIGVIIEMRDRVAPEKIESIHVDSHYMAWHEIGGGQDDVEAKWNPRTKETADHSLPYLLAVALLDGDVTVDSFEESRFDDPRVHEVMRKITIAADDELERRFRSPIQEMVARLQVKLDDGTVLTEEGTFPRGHWRNPMTDEELDRKASAMMGQVLAEDDAAELLALIRSLPELDTVGQLTRLGRRWRADETA